MIRPTATLPTLTGLGADIHVPGYQVPLPRPGARRTWLFDEDVTVTELPSGAFEVVAADVTALITAADMASAGAQVANLICARLHDARRRVAGDDGIAERLAAMLAWGLGVAV